MGAFRSKFAWAARVALLSMSFVSLAMTFAGAAQAGYLDGFEQGDTFFDDGVGVVHVRPSCETSTTGLAAAAPTVVSPTATQPDAPCATQASCPLPGRASPAGTTLRRQVDPPSSDTHSASPPPKATIITTSPARA